MHTYLHGNRGKNATLTENFAYVLKGRSVRERCQISLQTPSKNQVNQPTPIFPKIIRKTFQGDQNSISPHSKPTQCQKRNSAIIPKIMKMFNILNNAARHLDNTEAARGFR